MEHSHVLMRVARRHAVSEFHSWLYRFQSRPTSSLSGNLRSDVQKFAKKTAQNRGSVSWILLLYWMLFVLAGTLNVSGEQFAAGGNHSIAVNTDGTVWTWGLNTSGQLGDNTLVAKDTPIQITVPCTPPAKVV